MSFRFYAEAMYGNEFYQVVCENLQTGRLVVLKDSLSLIEARAFAEKMEALADNTKLPIEDRNESDIDAR
jgi:hypothetical protein